MPRRISYRFPISQFLRHSHRDQFETLTGVATHLPVHLLYVHEIVSVFPRRSLFSDQNCSIEQLEWRNAKKKKNMRRVIEIKVSGKENTADNFSKRWLRKLRKEFAIIAASLPLTRILRKDWTRDASSTTSNGTHEVKSFCIAHSRVKPCCFNGLRAGA